MTENTDNNGLQFFCGNCDTHLPKEDWSLRTTDGTAVAEIDCPDCGEYNDFRIGADRD